MLEDEYEPSIAYRKGDFKLKQPVCSGWEKARNRMLIVLETVDGKDLKLGRLLSDRTTSATVVKNVIRHSRMAAVAEDEGLPEFKFAVTNFNNARTFDLEKDARQGHNQRFAKRIREMIDQLRPTHVLVCGDYAFRFTFPKIDNIEQKRGWVHRQKQGDHRFLVTNTLDLEPLYSNRQNKDIDDEDDDPGKEQFGKSNLLGFVIRNATNLFLGRHLYSLKHIQPNPVYIHTTSRFEKMMRIVRKAPIVSLDTETKNLSVTQNKIFIIQLATSSDRGFVLPLYHPDTPFTSGELKDINGEMREWLNAKPEEHFKYFLMMNGAFDLRVCRAQFKIPLIRKPVWDVVAGETCFHPDTLVLTEMGLLPIRDVMGTDTLVASFNHEENRLEFKPVLNSVVKDNSEDLFEIAYEGGTIRVTASHKIWSNTRSKYIRADEITVDEDLLLSGSLSESSREDHQ